MNNISLFSGSTNTIETDYFSIKGNLFLCGNTLIPLNNISMISSKNLNVPVFPSWSAGLILIGLIFFGFSKLISVLAILAGAFWIFYWYNRVSQIKKQRKLNIKLNSGDSFSLIFYDKEFLNKVISVLTEILISPKSEKNITFNIKENTFNDHSGIINH